MLKKWLNKRKVSKLTSQETTWYFKLDNQNCLEVYSGKVPTSFEMDYISVSTRCGTIENVVEFLDKALKAMSTNEHLPKSTGVSRNKGETTLTAYLTKLDGFPYPIRIADEQISKLLFQLSESLAVIKIEDEIRHSYYTRKLKPYVIEAIEFRLLLINGIN